MRPLGRPCHGAGSPTRPRNAEVANRIAHRFDATEAGRCYQAADRACLVPAVFDDEPARSAQPDRSPLDDFRQAAEPVSLVGERKRRLMRQ